MLGGASFALDWMTAAALVYAAGVLIGLATIDARPVPRLALAVLWPLGPLAFVVTIAILIIAALVAFPVVGAVVVAVVAAALVWGLTVCCGA